MIKLSTTRKVIQESSIVQAVLTSIIISNTTKQEIIRIEWSLLSFKVRRVKDILLLSKVDIHYRKEMTPNISMMVKNKKKFVIFSFLKKLYYRYIPSSFPKKEKSFIKINLTEKAFQCFFTKPKQELKIKNLDKAFNDHLPNTSSCLNMI